MLTCPYSVHEMSSEVLSMPEEFYSQERADKIAKELNEIMPTDLSGAIAFYHGITPLDLANSPNMKELRDIYIENKMKEVIDLYIRNGLSPKLAWYMLLVQFAPDKLELK